jgi:hypothetical protein
MDGIILAFQAFVYSEYVRYIESVHNVDTLWTDYLEIRILRTVLVQNGSKCKV